LPDPTTKPSRDREGAVLPRVTVIIPTLAADAALEECVRSLHAQTFRDFDIVVIDNSGSNRAKTLPALREVKTIIENPQNAGFGAAINQGIAASRTPFIAILNDDTVVHPDCLKSMLHCIEARYEIGMCAPQIRLAGSDKLDSAGMLVARDGSSKQRGHGQPVSAFSRPQQALLPSGCAAMYRRDMLDEIGGFDERFFLYCEDTDLGLRARWKLWECMYAPSAIVEHRYSHSAGRASPLKAFYVERNRLFVVAKNYPLQDLLLAPLFSLVRYFWHFVYALNGRGKAAEYQGSTASLPLVAVRAWFAALGAAPYLWRQRRKIRRHARATPKQFHRFLSDYRIGERQVASL
jgi:GT2 family glycosyltransferase